MKNISIKRSAIAVALLFPLGMMAYKVVTSDGETEVTVEPLTENIFRLTAVPAGDSVVFSQSQSVVLTAADVASHSHDMEDEFIVETATTTIKVDKATGTVAFYDSDDNVLLREASPVDNASEVKVVSFLMPDSVLFYGAGERGHSLTLNGDSLSFYNRQNYGYTEGDPRLSQMGISVPWIVGDSGIGVLIDDYNKAVITLGDTIAYRSQTAKPLSYYFVNGGNLAEATAALSQITGRQSLPPLWSLGYITSKYGYHTQDETLGVVDTLKTHGFPVDGIVLDLYWYGKETDMGRLEWNPTQWPDHKAMLDSLKSLGVNTVLITQPYINKIGVLDNYNLLDSLGLLTKDAEGKTRDVTTWVGEAGMFDMANPATREWLWNRLKTLTEDGVAGWWGDLGEPEVHPTDIVHANGETAEEFHNVYGNIWSSLIYNGLRKDFPEMRPLLMMRGGTAGLQRYSVMPWTTDVSRSWEGFQPQIKLLLSSGLSGLGYMSSDIGGFAVDQYNPTDSELYVRWLQMGAFTPTLRTHAQLMPEPYHYPEYEDISLAYIKMRYQWLPYNYTLAYENAAYGLPLARPLNFRGDNPGEKFTVDDEYLWGDEVLVAPVMKQGAREREVLFPAGEWVDFFNPTLKYAGGTTATVEAPLDKLPLFVRAGSFIPLYMGEVNNVGDYNPQNLTVRYYPSKSESSYTLFDDDRLSPVSLEKGNYQLTTFEGRDNGDTIDIRIDTNGGRYVGMGDYKHLTLEVVDIDRPRHIVMTPGAPIPQMVTPGMTARYGWHYDSSSRCLTIVFPWDFKQRDIRIEMLPD